MWEVGLHRLAQVRELQPRLLGVRLVPGVHRLRRPAAQGLPAGRVHQEVADDDQLPRGRQGSATVSDMRQALGTNRRVVVPLAEYLDRTGVTVRKGDLRVLR